MKPEILVFGAILSVALLAPVRARAERPLTYREALSAAMQANPDLVRSGLSAQGSEASLLSAKGLFDPEFSVGGTWRRSFQEGFFQGFPFEADSRFWDLRTQVAGTAPSGTSFSAGGSVDRNHSTYVTEFGVGAEDERLQDAYTSELSVSVTQQILRGVKLSYNLRTITRARDGWTLSDLGRERTRQETLAQTARAYWTLDYQVRLARIARDALGVAEEALRVGALRVASGDLAPVEKTRLEAALVQAQADELAAGIAMRSAADSLLLLMGEAPGAEPVPATPPGEVPPLDLDPADAVTVALAQNLDLAIARASLEQARHEHAFAKHAILPSLSTTLSGGIGAQDETLGATIGGLFREQSFPYYGVSGTFSVPIGNRSARGEVERTAFELEAGEVDLAALERLVRSQVEQQVRDLASGRRKVELADVNLDLAEETLAAEEALAEAGRSIQKDVLEARAAVSRARAEAAGARTAFRISQVELLRLQGQVGEELP